jgi:hypothetical protein
MDPFPPLDLAVRSPPHGYFLCVGSGRWITATWLLSVHRIWPLDHRHMATFYASDLAVGSPPRGSFLCIGSGHWITTTWLFYTRRIWPLDSRHVARFYPSDLAVRFSPCGFFLTVRSGPDLRLEGDHVSINEWLAWYTVRRKWYGCAPSISTWHRSDGYSGPEYTVFVARIERFSSSQVARIRTVFSLCAKSVLCRQ